MKVFASADRSTPTNQLDLTRAPLHSPAKLSANADVEEFLVLSQVIVVQQLFRSVFEIIAQLLQRSTSERPTDEMMARRALYGGLELHVRPKVAKNTSVRTLIRPPAPNAPGGTSTGSHLLSTTVVALSSPVQDLACPLRRDAVAVDAMRRRLAAQHDPSCCNQC